MNEDLVPESERSVSPRNSVDRADGAVGAQPFPEDRRAVEKVIRPVAESEQQPRGSSSQQLGQRAAEQDAVQQLEEEEPMVEASVMPPWRHSSETEEEEEEEVYSQP